MKIEDAIILFAEFKQAERLKARSVADYLRYLREFVAFLPDDLEVVAVKSSDVARFIANRAAFVSPSTGKPLSDRTLLAYYRALSAFFNWVETCDEAGNAPSPLGHGHNKKVKPPKLAKRMARVADAADLTLLIDSIPAGTWIDLRDRAILKLFRDTGLRVGELAALRVVHVNLVEREAFVAGGKGDKDRFVFFTADTANALRQYLFVLQVDAGHAPAHLFCSALNQHGELRTKPLTVSGVTQILKRRCKAAGIPRINPHSIRHLFCDKALNDDNVPLETVSKLAGHASAEFTERVYAPLKKHKMKRDYDANWK